MRKELVSHDELLRNLDYDPVSGVFVWKVASKNHLYNIGDVARDCIDWSGYKTLWLNGRSYKQHRLAWFFIYKEWPADVIDHINRDKTDNRIENLRCISRRQNAQNRMLNKNNISGFRGVGWHKATGKWRARIGVNNRLIDLGVFDDIEQAKSAWLSAVKVLHEFCPMEIKNEQIGQI